MNPQFNFGRSQFEPLNFGDSSFKQAGIYEMQEIKSIESYESFDRMNT